MIRRVQNVWNIIGSLWTTFSTCRPLCFVAVHISSTFTVNKAWDTVHGDDVTYPSISLPSFLSAPLVKCIRLGDRPTEDTTSVYIGRHHSRTDVTHGGTADMNLWKCRSELEYVGCSLYSVHYIRAAATGFLTAVLRGTESATAFMFVGSHTIQSNKQQCAPCEGRLLSLLLFSVSLQNKNMPFSHSVLCCCLEYDAM